MNLDESESSSMHFTLQAIFIIQKRKWKWLLTWLVATPWHLSAWLSVRHWPTRAWTSTSPSPSTPTSLSPWTPGRLKGILLWQRRGQALPHRGGMPEEEKPSWKGNSTLFLFHLLHRTLQQKIMWRLVRWKLSSVNNVVTSSSLKMAWRSTRVKLTKWTQLHHRLTA